MGIHNPINVAVCADHFDKIPKDKLTEDFTEIEDVIYAAAEAVGERNLITDISWSKDVTIREKFLCFDRETLEKYLPNTYEHLQQLTSNACNEYASEKLKLQVK